MSPLGAHTDHQQGLTTGFGLDHGLSLAFRPVAEVAFRLKSTRESTPANFDSRTARNPVGDWSDHLRGVAVLLDEQAALTRGLEGLVDGELPPGGIASSAALQCAFLLALDAIHGRRRKPREAAELVAAAEARAVGVEVGLLDPAVILSARKDAIVSIDCRSRKITLRPLPANLPPFEILLVDSGMPRSLRETPYNERVAGCRAAAGALGVTGDRPVLRGTSLEELRRRRAELDPSLALLAEHVLGENKRVRIGLEALAAGDLISFGRLMSASGESLTRCFGCGTPETRALLDLLLSSDGVLGASYAGGGFGGFVQALIWPGAEERLAEPLLGAYRKRHPEAGAAARLYVVGLGDRAHVI
jgi:galactokinase/galacturonokinase